MEECDVLFYGGVLFWCKANEKDGKFNFFVIWYFVFVWCNEFVFFLPCSVASFLLSSTMNLGVIRIDRQVTLITQHILLINMVSYWSVSQNRWLFKEDVTVDCTEMFWCRCTHLSIRGSHKAKWRQPLLNQFTFSMWYWCLGSVGLLFNEAVPKCWW